MKGKSIPGPIRDENPCKYCKEKRHPGCQDKCPDRAKWVAEIRRVNANRRKYRAMCQIRKDWLY